MLTILLVISTIILYFTGIQLTVSANGIAVFLFLLIDCVFTFNIVKVINGGVSDGSVRKGGG